MMKGIFRLWLTSSRYTVTYDPDKVLTLMDSLSNNKRLSIELHEKKLSTFLDYLVGQGSSLSKNYSWIMLYFYSKQGYITAILKTTKPGRHQALLTFEQFPSNKKHCIVDCIDKYNRRKFALSESQSCKLKHVLL